MDIKTGEIKNFRTNLRIYCDKLKNKTDHSQLQGTVDVNFKEQTLSFDKVDTKLQDFYNTLKNEVNAVLGKKKSTKSNLR
ncbi:MAG: hypothetical protein CM1200mP16_01540 [Nitrospina sp.]|nr:MAG: hypothetical protein CM1200mP16_01540 [Nitrospina sp.]